jgi:hypothetical protein
MRSRFEFTFHVVTNIDADAELALCGSLGWEIRGIALRPDGYVIVALQRPLDEDVPLPLANAIAATLEAPLHAPLESEASH